MNLLILEPPYSHLFKELVGALKPKTTFVHLFNLGYLVFLPKLRFSLITRELRKRNPSPESIKRVEGIRSLANSNIKSPTPSELKLMACYLEFLRNFIAKRQITHIICHNDLRWQHAVAREVAKELGVTIFFLEDGLLRPHTLTFDAQGVNAFSSVPQEPEFYQQGNFQISKGFRKIRQPWSKRIQRLLFFSAFLCLNKVGDILRLNVKLRNKYYSFTQYGKLFLAKLDLVSSPPMNVEISKKYIFVPLQVTKDTQTIIHSQFGGTQEVIDLLETAYSELPDDLRREYSLVFKKHPMEAHVNYRFRDDSLVSAGNTGQLLEGASLVVLVNSATIVEALIKKKKIISLGNSHYNIPGVLLKSTPAQICADIESKLKDPAPENESLRQSFLNFLIYHYQINGNIFYYDEETINRMKERLTLGPAR